MAWHQTGRARVRARSPSAFGVCDRCGLLYNLRDLKWQFQWQGMQLQNLRILVCDICLDIPQVQLRTIIFPPDPVPVFNARPENYTAEVPSYISTLTGTHLTTVSGTNMVTVSKITPTPDPNQPYLVPADF